MAESLNNAEKTNKPWLFQKGNPGGGRPKDSFSLKTIIKQKLQQMSPDGRRTAAEMFCENLIQDGLDGQDKARDLIMSFLERKPATEVEISEVEGLKSNTNDIYED